jgi:GTP-binding protein YchF
MEVGIVGIPYSGKSTLFQALTGLEAQMPGSIKPMVGVAPIPDPRLSLITSLVPTKKVVPATLKVVDIPGLVSGASEGAGSGNAFLSTIRDVDAIIHLVRCFDRPDVPHVDGSIDPARDVDNVDTELILADLEMVENAIPRAEKSARKKEGDSVARLALLTKIKPVLEEGRSVRSVELSADESKLLKSMQMLSAKPVLYVANVGEDDPKGEGPLPTLVREIASAQHAGFAPVCASIEAELGELEEADRAEMLESMGLAEPALAALARAAYDLLGLQSFYTAGDKENRAWTVRKGATAPQAAGAIHTDFERGFIRAEVYSVADLAELKSEKAIKEKGRMRVEGKAYVMQDGDVCHFLFNL